MSDVQLSKTEAKILTDAAARGGKLALPDRLTPTSRTRTIGRFLHDGLVVQEPDGEDHLLTRAGYRAVGLEPPRVVRAGTKQAPVLELLGRGEGASLGELVAATGWLPHTTRAVLSRLRSAGQPLGKTERPDGATAYRIEAAAA
jgi:hypothetical protein